MSDSNTQEAPRAPVKIKGRWKSALSLSFASMLDNNEGTSFITAMFPLIREQLGLTLGVLGWMAAIPKIMAVIFGPFWAAMSRRYNRKTILVFATGLWGLWAVGIGLAQNVGQLFAMVVISLIGASASQPLMQEIIMDLFGEDERGKAVSIVFGISSFVFLPMQAVNAWLSTMASGWRYGFFGAGALSAISGLLIWIFLKDPGRGASEEALADLDKDQRSYEKGIKWSEIKELFKVKTFVLMLIQRLLSGHLLMISMGVIYMVEVLNFSLQEANLMMMPLIGGMLSGIFTFGFIADKIHKRHHRYGRIGTIQVIQFVYAVLAVLGTQFIYPDKTIYMVLFFLMGFFASANMGVNRPIVASVIRPELRGTAFALFVSVFEAIAWAIFNILAGQLGETIGLKTVFFMVLVVLMLVNTLFITLLYKPYAKDVQIMKKQMEEQRQRSLKGSAAPKE